MLKQCTGRHLTVGFFVDGHESNVKAFENGFHHLLNRRTLHSVQATDVEEIFRFVFIFIIVSGKFARRF